MGGRIYGFLSYGFFSSVSFLGVMGFSVLVRPLVQCLHMGLAAQAKKGLPCPFDLAGSAVSAF